MDIADIERLTMGFGGGIGRMREVCGTVSGMAFVISALYADEGKTSVYTRIQKLPKNLKRKTAQ